MPEGPELKIACDSLKNLLIGKNLIEFNILSGRYFPENRYPEKYLEFKNLLPLSIKKIGVKGKLLYFIFENNWVLLNTFGMTGRWTLNKQKHCHIEIKINDISLWFCDTRRFGTIKFIDNIDLLNNKIQKKLGPDILNNDISCDEFLDIMNKHQNKNITKVLMNQSILSGIGNYIKSESLYRSKISPHNNVIDINKEKLISLYDSIKYVMNTSYLSQGATISSYYNINDEKGTYNFKFLVYGRQYDDLGNKIIHEKTKDGRTSHWVQSIEE